MSDETGGATPSRNDCVTITCPVCQQPFTRRGKRRWCSGACRAAAWRRRHQVAGPVLAVPAVALVGLSPCTSARAAGHGPWASSAARTVAPSCARWAWEGSARTVTNRSR